MIAPTCGSIRIVIADDHPLLREGIKAMLSRQPDFDVVGEAATGDETLQTVLQHRPDILIFDLRMPGLPSELIVVEACKAHPALKTLVLSADDDDALIRSVSRAQISGYILKDEGPEYLAQGIRVIQAGGFWFSKSVAQKLKALSGSQVDPLSIFTVRELAVLRLIGRGRENQAIASALGLVLQTVRNYVRAVYSKMDVHSRAEAVVWAREHGLQ